MGEEPITDSSVSLHPLKLIAYPPKAAFFAFAMLASFPSWVWEPPPGASRSDGGYHRRITSGMQAKNTTDGAPATMAELPGGGIPPGGSREPGGGRAAPSARGGKRGHHLAGEPGELLAELLR